MFFDSRDKRDIKLTSHSFYFENIPLKINLLDNNERETMKLLNASYNERKQRKVEKAQIESRMLLERCVKLIFLSSQLSSDHLVVLNIVNSSHHIASHR